MELVKVIGIIALIVFLVAYIGDMTTSWFIHNEETLKKVDQILDCIAFGGITVALACGLIHLFS